MKKKSIKQINNEVNTLINENHISAEVMFVSEDYVTIQVDEGDWKHDHLFLDRLMKEYGYLKIDETVTGEDGSDCYSAEHNYVEKNSDKVKLYSWLNK